MRSPVNTPRRVLEAVLRGLLIAALGAGLWLATRMLHERANLAASGGSAEVSAALATWSTVEAPGRVHVRFDSMPSHTVRDWLAAVARTVPDGDRGPQRTRASWSGDSLQPIAISVASVVDPTRPVRVAIAAPAGSQVVISDSIGVIDTVVSGASSKGGALTVTDATGGLRAAFAGNVARGVASDSAIIRPVLVLGVAGWEAKFVAAALEERGWTVRARLAVAPSGDVMQGPPALRIDTASFAAVIALDTSATRYATQIASYVRDGGGLIAAGEGAALPSLASLMPARAKAASLRGQFEADSGRPRMALAVSPLDERSASAVVLDTVDERVAVVARRVGRGRVLQVGYHDTWRWRLAGFDDPVRAHREWWSAMVSSVAHAPRAPRDVDHASLDPMPLAGLVDVLGAPVSSDSVASTMNRAKTLQDPRLLAVLFTIALAALVLETASRRLRGAP